MSFFSSSTSRLIIPRWKQTNAQRFATPQDTLAASGKYASTEGRFSIIDERRKESTSIDSSDSTTDSELDYKTSKIFRTKKICSQSTGAAAIQAQRPTLKKNAQMSGSRFKIVPLESRYKRGRWACWDYYDTEGTKKVKEPRTAPPLISKFSNSLTIKSFKNIPMTSMNPSDDIPLTAPPNDQPAVSFSFDFSDDSDVENHPSKKKEATRTTSKRHSSPRPIPQLKTIDSKTNGDNRCKLNLDAMDVETPIGGRMTPVELLHNFGLEGSLSVTYNDRSLLDLLPGTIPPVGSPRSNYNRGLSTSAGGAGGPGANSSVVAIDSKIEQAMDLVKTHLMFAVREEVKVLRAKIIELESTIFQLEAENSVLREHVPADILNKMNMQSPSQNSTTTAAV